MGEVEQSGVSGASANYRRMFLFFVLDVVYQFFLPHTRTSLIGKVDRLLRHTGRPQRRSPDQREQLPARKEREPSHGEREEKSSERGERDIYLI